MTRIVEAGVPQGSVLGLLLWNLTFNQIIRAKTKNGYRLMAYADGTLILAMAKSVDTARRRATLQIARTVRQIKDLKLEISSAKTEIVVFTPGRKVPPEVEITVDGETVRSKRTIKYLGVILDDKLTFTEHIKYVESKTNSYEIIMEINAQPTWTYREKAAIIR